MKEGEILLSKQEFILISMEINIFFQRIMKEHLFLIETNLQPVECDYIEEAKMLKQNFEQLLSETVYYGSGVISESSIRSNEFVTPYTLRAEEVTSMFTGAKIDTRITKAEYELGKASKYNYRKDLEKVAHDINSKSYCLLEDVIAFQEKLISKSLECKIFITLYDEMLEHDTREAKYYLELLKCLRNRTLPNNTLCEELNFWNNIMGEHAQFIDGMLDPTERKLKQTAASTAKAFEKLVLECVRTTEKQITLASLDSTDEIRDFKRSSTEVILKCKIKSLIPPILADHVLREANHYLRLLCMIKR